MTDQQGEGLDAPPQVDTPSVEGDNPPIGTANSATSPAHKTTPSTERVRQSRRTTEERCEESLDKVYADFVKYDSKRKQPHMEWDGAKFIPQSPAPQPYVEVNATIMLAAHEKFGISWKGSRRGVYSSRSVEGIADSGCQTCLAGVDFLEKIGCPKDFLVPTGHGIIGISRTSLDIIGSVFLRLELDGIVARQMVHVSPTVRGFFLSETALRQLHVLNDEFPRPDPLSEAGAAMHQCDCCEEGVSCPPRSSTPDRPTQIPFEPVAENREKLKEWLLQAFEASAFNRCTHQPLQAMTGAPMKIIQKEGVTPSYSFTPIPVPFNWKKKVKDDLDRDVRLGIIEPVPQGAITDWCSRMVIALKANGIDLRRMIDFQRLNDATYRETHHTPSPFNLVSSIPPDMLKTVLDAWNGYHSLLLDPESKRFTAFITEFGRYWYNRGPQGYHGTGDAYTRRFDDITKDEERYLRIVDDGLLYDGDLEQAFWHTFDHLKLCADNGIVFNPEKFQFGGEEVEYAGFEVTMDGFRPSSRILESIANFPTPTNITDVKAWFGLVGHVSYAASLGEVMQPFRTLLATKGQTFYWDESLDEAFKQSKHDIVELVKEGVRTYDTKKQTCLTTDWSKEGIGFSLTQKHCSCHGPANPNCGNDHWKLVFAGSKALNNAESRYAPIEGEALAVAHGLEKSRMFTLGCRDLTVVTDHKPLTRILNDRSLDAISNPRVFKFKERTLPFQYRIVHVPGGSTAMKTADAMSRHPTTESGPVDDVDRTAKAFAVSQGDAIESVTWEAVDGAAAVDAECLSLVRLILDGFPDTKSSLPPELQRYWGMREEMYVIGNVPFKGRKMLIPERLRPQVLDGLHAANQGVTGMLANARDRFFWPGLDAAIQQLRLQCRRCNETAPSQPAEPLIITPPPEYPFQQVVSDFCNLEGHNFLIYADRYSGWVEVERLASNTFRNVQRTFLRWFATYGVPEEISSDGGPPFNSGDYKQFCVNWGVSRRLSSAHYPQSNGRAEAAVKSVKRILSGNINPVSGSLDTSSATRALMAHRNTPAQDTGVSPSILLFGRPMRDHLPRSKRELRPEWDSIARSREQALANRVNRSPIVPTSSRRELTALAIGDNVQIQNQQGNRPNRWYSTGIVTEVLPNRQYNVMKDGSRRVTLRNRRFLRKISPLGRQIPEQPLAIVDPTNETPSTQNVVDDETTYHPMEEVPATPEQPVPSPSSETGSTPRKSVDPALTSAPDVHLRRGGRDRKQRKPFVAKMTGKYHE